jgi:hypothetical protein
MKAKIFKNYLHCTVPYIKKNYYRSREQVYDNGIDTQQFKTGRWDGDNFIPLTEVASFQAIKFGINMFKQMRQNMYKPWVLVH